MRGKQRFECTCHNAGGCDEDVVLSGVLFLENFYWLDELFAFSVVKISEIVFLPDDKPSAELCLHKLCRGAKEG